MEEKVGLWQRIQDNTSMMTSKSSQINVQRATPRQYLIPYNIVVQPVPIVNSPNAAWPVPANIFTYPLQKLDRLKEGVRQQLLV